MISLDERTKDMKFYVLYHKNCFDGFGSAFCAWLHFGDYAKYIPVAYGDSLPEIPDGAFVYILDFSFHKNVLLELSNRTTLVVLDHHKSAEEDLVGLPFCKFDMTKSGAKLSYDFFIQMSPEICEYQWFIDYISDRDLWENKLPGTEEVHSALSSYPKNFEVWKEIGKNTSRLYEEGKPILRHAKTTVRMMCDQSFMTDRFADLGYPEVPCVNATGYWSEICHEMLERFPEHPFVTAYFKRGDGKTQWSLRSRTSEDFDVTKIARGCGGGGHKHASGFTE